MSVVFSITGILTLMLLVGAFHFWAQRAALHALSLPCITILTSIIYFYVMTLGYLVNGDEGFFGAYLTSLDRTFWAVALYIVGALLAFQSRSRLLTASPLMSPPVERRFVPTMYWILLALALAGLAGKVLFGQLNVGASDDAETAAVTNVNFLQLSDSIVIALVIVALVRDNFRWKSLLALAGAIMIFLIDGFRFRIVVVLSAALISYALTRGLKLRTIYVVMGAIVAIILLNAIGITRQYGAGLDLSRVQGMGWSQLFLTFGGEVGPVFVLNNLVNAPPPLIGADPIIIAVARFVPTFFWPQKPYPYYLEYYPAGFPDLAANSGGIAGTQHSEFFLMGGWIGLPIIAFLFFQIALLVQSRLRYLSREARIAGTAIVPSIFGFYAQQRGYTFQIAAEALFTLAPLFIMHWGGGKRLPAASPEGALATSGAR